MSNSLPVVMTAQGAVPTSPTNLLQTIIDKAKARSPGFDANLPGTLIEDITSTEVGAVALLDQARVDAINSITPYGANAAILAQQGAMLGIPRGQPTRTYVYEQFSGPAGYVIPQGFTVSDGSHAYALSEGGVIGSSGTSPLLKAVATQSGSWSVPAGSVTQIVTSVPSQYTLTVTNPSAGTPGSGEQTVPEYRTQIMEAFKAPAQGVATYLSGQLKKITGVTPRLVRVLQASNGWEIICGGGDKYEVANAIYGGVVDLTTLKGSQVSNSRNISASLVVPPNNYTITYVAPPAQTVTGTVTWNTRLASFTAAAQVNQLGAKAIVDYINAIPVGQPVNLIEMDSAFKDAISGVLSADNLTALSYSLDVNGSSVSPQAGTKIITSDPESYFSAAANAITVQKG